jgi:aspartokinase/homoserine dehydrogenase 1
VIRKLVILTREAGYQVEQKDVKLECIIPEKYFEGTPDDFRNSVTEMDAVFETRRHMAPGRM